MKRFIIILGLTLLISVAKSQGYTPFNFESGEWVVRYDVKVSLFGGPYCTEQIDSVMFYCNGDTIINDTSFKKLFYKGYSTCPTWRYISGYYGAIRNDIPNKRVLFNQGGNIVIYDFNMHVGDSVCNITTFLPVTFYICGTVTSIDSVQFCSRYFKRYNVTDYLQNVYSIIEGIGSPDGLFTTTAWFSDLLCYTEINNSACPACEPFLSVKNRFSDKTVIKTNPGSDQVYISAEGEISSLEIFDIFGRLAYSNYNINSKTARAFIVEKGLFVLRVRVADKLIVRKIIKQ